MNNHAEVPDRPHGVVGWGCALLYVIGLTFAALCVMAVSLLVTILVAVCASDDAWKRYRAFVAREKADIKAFDAIYDRN